MSQDMNDEDWFIIRDLLELRRKQITKIIDDVRSQQEHQVCLHLR